MNRIKIFNYKRMVVDQEQLDLIILQVIFIYCVKPIYYKSTLKMQDLLLAQIEGLQMSTTQLESNTLLSYQEQKNVQMIATFGRYFHNMKQAYLSSPQSKIYEKLLSEYSLLGNSIWSHSSQILRYLKLLNKQSNQKGNRLVLVSHLHYHSQSPLLALYFKLMKHRVALLGSRKQIHRGWANCTAKFTQIDKVTAFKQVMASQAVQVKYFECPDEDEIENIDEIGDKLDIEIIDLFNTHGSYFTPYMLSKIKRQKKQDKKNKFYLFYCHPSQNNELIYFLKRVYNQQINQISVQTVFPYQTATIVSNKFEQQLLQFLNQQLNHPTKQDVIIFNEPTQEFVKNIKNCLKRNSIDLLKHVHIISKANQTKKQSLPPPPAFLSKLSCVPSLSQKGSQSQKKKQVMQESSSQQSSKIKATQSNISVTSTNQRIPKSSHTQNNIYIAPNFKTLIEWGYDLSHVFYVFDYQNDQSFYYDYDLRTYVDHSQEFITQKEQLLRISCIAIQKIGKFCFVQDNEAEKIKQNQHIQQLVGDGKTKDIGCYCLQMIQGQHDYFWYEAQKCKQIKNCVDALCQQQIIRKLQKQQGQEYPRYQIIDKQVYKAVKKIRDLNPILCKVIIKAKNGQQQQEVAPNRLALQLAIATSVMMTPGSLKQTVSGNSVTNRPTQIWRKSGYLHSALDAIIRAKIIQNREMEGLQKKNSKRKSLSRKQNSHESDMFGDLFSVLKAERITFDEMKLQDLLREEFINEAVFHSIVDTTQKICQVLQLKNYNFTCFQDIDLILADILQKTEKSIGAYSGSRRIGYFKKGLTDGIFPSKSSLLSVLNQRPSFIFITRLSRTLSADGNQKLQILMCNRVQEQKLIQCIGSLPSRKTKSCGDVQLEYHGVTSATFKSLWRNNGSDIESFQDKFGCFVEPNEQIAIISIYCPKQKQQIVKKQFDALLMKVKEKMASQTKIAHYLGSTSLLLKTGGSVFQVIKDKYINKCILSNLDLSVETEDLQELFQQFFVLKDIKVVRQSASAPFKVAYIQFQSQKDYYRFFQYFNECQYLNRYMKVIPVESLPATSTYKQQMYLQFTWNAWKSNQQALVEFQQEQSANKCLESLKKQKLDQKLVKTQLKKNNVIYITGLNSLTDEVNLQLALSNYGKIKSIQISKTPSKQSSKNLQSFLEEQIRRVVADPGELVVKNVQKIKNGLRKCKVIYKNEAKLNQTITKLKEKVGVMGVGKIHIESWFVYPIKIPHGYLALYQQLVNLVLSKMPQNRMKIQNIIYNDHEYIVGRSHLKQEIDVFKLNINRQMQGYGAELQGTQASILLTEVGIANLLDIQQKYNCRLIPDFAKKKLVIICLQENIKTIRQEIKARAEDKFFYRISLNQKAFKHFKQNPELCTKLKSQYFLQDLTLQQVGRNLLLEGSANFVEKAFNYLMHIIQSVSKPSQQEMLNSDVCGICCVEPFRPYRLQQCAHKFCLNCLLDYITMALADITMFPIKCPQCLIEMAIIDLNQLLTPQTWAKLNQMALNQYVGRNPEIISNCYTAGCKQVNFLIKNNFSCDECQQSYCIECKLNYHPGLTCQQAKNGGNTAFQKYMKQNGIRKCPNQNCKMPIMRTDGCYRVTCSRCNKSMCFKCQPEKMIAYDHYNDCYKHLTDVHGGYW